MKLHRFSTKKNSRILICSTAESLSVVSENEVVVMFVTADGESIARNIAERHKII